MSKGMLGKLPLSDVWGPVSDLMEKLAGPEGEKWLAGLNKFLRGEAWPQDRHIIDLDADARCPEGWTVEYHRKMGQWEWNPDEITRWLSERQKNGVVRGHDLREEVMEQNPLNANLLDFLLAQPHLIPEHWKRGISSFWGTILRRPDGCLGVRYLVWDGRRWHSNFFSLDCYWSAVGSAVVFPAS